MSHSMYTSLSGAVVEEANLEVISNNLANAQTPGFKGQRLSFHALLAAQNGVDPKASPRVQVEVASTQNDFTQGNMKATGNPLDVALRGPGFFAVDTDHGMRLTRQGNFLHSPDGALRTQSGHEVMGENGPIRARADMPMSIDKTGGVYSAGLYIDSIKRVYAQNPTDLAREGNSLWKVENEAALASVTTGLEVGSLEMSNVNAVTSMTQLINTQRHYEMYHRAIENSRNIQQKAAQELG